MSTSSRPSLSAGQHLMGVTRYLRTARLLSGRRGPHAVWRNLAGRFWMFVLLGLCCLAPVSLAEQLAQEPPALLLADAPAYPDLEREPEAADLPWIYTPVKAPDQKQLLQPPDRTAVRSVVSNVDAAGRRADLSIPDATHNFRIFARPYEALFADLRVQTYRQPDILPIFSLYRTGSDTCVLGLNTLPDYWARVTEKLVYFDRDDELSIFQEVAVAHEVGHCVASRLIEGINRRWSVAQRELFADIFALIHVQYYLPELRDEAFSQLVRFRAGPPVDQNRPDSTSLRRVYNRLETLWPQPTGNLEPMNQRVELALELMDFLKTPEPPLAGTSPPAVGSGTWLKTQPSSEATGNADTRAAPAATDRPSPLPILD